METKDEVKNLPQETEFTPEAYFFRIDQTSKTDLKAPLMLLPTSNRLEKNTGSTQMSEAPVMF